ANSSQRQAQKQTAASSTVTRLLDENEVFRRWYNPRRWHCANSSQRQAQKQTAASSTVTRLLDENEVFRRWY
ncbi:hypothetical protein R3X39_26290, partial [Salmonella enterica subsp. enterica serovar Agona]|nr:hypothetical protein [Salmonella enterica subsp. enterica serovar Agona]